MTPKAGDRVAWVLDEGEQDDGMRGTVREPTRIELDYLESCAPSFRESVRGHVIVAWDGEEPWEGVWVDPAELRPAAAEEVVK